MKRWLAAAELVGLPGLPATKSGFIRLATREAWPCRPRSGRGGGAEYQVEALPAATRSALTCREMAAAAAAERQSIGAASAAPRDSRQATAESSLKATAGLTGWKREHLDLRAALWQALDEHHRRSGCSWGATLAAYNSGALIVAKAVRAYRPTLSAITLERMRAAVNSGGTAALTTAYGNRKDSGAVDSQPALREFVLAMLAEHPHARASQILIAAERRFRNVPDMRLPSECRLRAWMKAWRSENRSLATALTSPDQWKNKYMTAFGDADQFVLRLNQRWEMDSTPADVQCIDGRHAIVGCIDVFSRRLKMLVSRVSKSEAIAGLLRECILDWGVPETVGTDQGKDYVGKHMTRVLGDLEIEQSRANKFSPWEKPFIERSLGVFSHDAAIELLPSFIGHDVEERQAIRSRLSFAQQLFSKNDTVPCDLTGAQLQAICDLYTDEIYAHRRHGGIDCTPVEKAASWQQVPRRISDVRALDLLLCPAVSNDGWRTVTKNGISVDNAWYIAAELGPRAGERVRCLTHPKDQGLIEVYATDPDTGELAWLCEAVAAEYAGIDRRDIATKARQLQAAQISRLRTEIRSSARRLKTRDVAAELLDDARARRGNVVALPQPSTPYSTPALNAAASSAAGPQMPASAGLDQRGRDLLRELEARPPAQVVQMPARPVNPQIGVDNRISRFLDIERRIGAGEAVGDDERKWFHNYQTTSEYRVGMLLRKGL